MNTTSVITSTYHGRFFIAAIEGYERIEHSEKTERSAFSLTLQHLICMIKNLPSLLLILTLASCAGSTSLRSDSAASDSDSIAAVREATPLPDTAYASAADVVCKTDTFLPDVSGQLTDFTDHYRTAPGHFTFRGNLLRDADFGGRVKGTPTSVDVAWTFATDVDMTPTKYGTWGGGTGWTGQPLYVHWDSAHFARQQQTAKGLTADFGAEEIILGSLCSRIYFLNFQTGKPSRDTLDAGNPIKGTGSLDPDLEGNLYYGQGVPRGADFGHEAFDLIAHNRFYFFNRDHKAYRHWDAYDSSPVAVGQFLFWPGENGTIYKYLRSHGSLRLHSTFRYTIKGDGMGAGVENSLCVYKNYGYFGDNHGDIVCLNLNTLRPVWHYDNLDDIDGTIVCEVQDDKPYIYSGCEVDRQGGSGTCQIVKLDGLTGQEMWKKSIPCTRVEKEKKHFDGGMYGTPLLGKGDCKDLLFLTICNDRGGGTGTLLAINRQSGETAYTVPLKHYAWSSPVGFYNEKNELFVFLGDTAGNVYLLRGRTGEVLFCKTMGGNFESSPVVIGNSAVVGSRGNTIYRFDIH